MPNEFLGTGQIPPRMSNAINVPSDKIIGKSTVTKLIGEKTTNY
jgi:hypothetical protein